jgi:predicted RNase H-like HicB family nuclease
MTTARRDLHYTMIIRWDPRDSIFVVSVPELPGCMTHGETYEEAIAQGQDAIEGWLEVAEADGKTPPPPRYFADSDIKLFSRECVTA